MKKLSILILLTITITTTYAQTVIDINGNTYPTVKIGNQEWMAKNLAATQAADSSELTSYPYLGIEDSVKTFGRLYDWENARKACPAGWHLPSDEEWTELADTLGGPEKAGGLLKEKGIAHWKAPNTGATNKSGFRALPVGYISPKGKYKNFNKKLAYYWSSTSFDNANAWGYFLTFNEPVIYRYGLSFSKKMGFSVRCVKD